MTVTTQQSIKELCDFVDFRDFFLHFKEDSPVYQKDKSDNLRMNCPSCGSNTKCYAYKNGCFCQKCRASWGIYDWLSNIEGYDNEAIAQILVSVAKEERINQRGVKKSQKIEPTEEEVEDMNNYAAMAHNNLTEETIQWWFARGVTREAVNRFQLGEKDGWYIMPLRDDNGVTFSIKRRWKGTKEDSPHNTRYESLRGSKNSYAPWILRNETTQFGIIVGGEIKALVLWSYLRAEGLPWAVISTAAGEGQWKPHWNEYMMFNHLVIWPDRDEAGFKFAANVHDNFRSDLPIVFPENTDAKAVDDYILEGGDALMEISRTMKMHGIPWRL